ncbi:class I SAM-dependent DNA methyltransferase [Sphaerisporangium perillae]|uniref:class I SAM-dependent DNA methyltransferase n=1 Tax=Sphaerisporangium perillae TaxID=2935860 RepID=UPI00200EFE2B|nr:class I SAM-dependent methyltransferase [Sphaerisporangium perillae]
MTGTTSTDHSVLFDAEHAKLFDLVYTARRKDYAAESKAVVQHIRARKPGARSLLDVGCGTGEHLRSLKDVFFDVEGLDLTPAMRELARNKLPQVPIHAGDMSDFALHRTFDAVICLHSSIAFLPLSRLKPAIACMARHLNPGGVLIVEPWYSPERATDRTVVSDIVRRDDGLTIARVSRGVIRDGEHHLETHFIVADADGVRHSADTQVMGIFRREEYQAAFAGAGCDPEYFEDGLAGRGLFVAVRR